MCVEGLRENLDSFRPYELSESRLSLPRMEKISPRGHFSEIPFEQTYSRVPVA